MYEVYSFHYTVHYLSFVIHFMIHYSLLIVLMSHSSKSIVVFVRIFFKIDYPVYFVQYNFHVYIYIYI